MQSASGHSSVFEGSPPGDCDEPSPNEPCTSIGRYIKLALLILMWLAFTVRFLNKNSHENFEFGVFTGDFDDQERKGQHNASGVDTSGRRF
jgi:hypothetical protein